MTTLSEHLLPEWIYAPELEESIHSAEDLDDFLQNNSILLSILDHIQEGISILSPELNVLFLNQPMKHWYHASSDSHSRKCYRLFHDRRQPCENCPAATAQKSKIPHTSCVPYKAGGDPDGEMSVHVSPIRNKDGHVVLLLEYVRNITYEKSQKNSIEGFKTRIELLERQNQLLLSSLTLCEEKYQNLENTITENMNNYILPVMDYMKQRIPPEDHELVSSIIDQSIYPITKQHTSVMNTLTGREREVALLIRDGYSSKQIADELFITKKAVDYHRANIRKKFDLDAKVNLKVFLEMNL